MNRAKAQSRWSDYERRAWSRGLADYQAVLRSLIAPATRARILDVGCGPGQWLAAAAECGSFAIGVDKALAPRAMQERGRYGYKLVRAMGEALPFRAGFFDAALLELVLPYANVEQCIMEVARVLGANGQVHGTCQGPGYYVCAAWREAIRSPRSAFRPITVLGYTLLHRAIRFDRYHFETFQTPAKIVRTLIATGFKNVETGAGGHPFDPRQDTLGLPVFFWFRASRRHREV